MEIEINLLLPEWGTWQAIEKPGLKPRGIMKIFKKAKILSVT